jgi:AcrR family transcriptional regulator
VGVVKALPRGPHSLTREQVADNQQHRLGQAMLELVGQKGYGATTVSEVVTRAGVSRKAFYEHYVNKEECFLAAYDAIAHDARHRVRRAYSEGEDPDRMEGAVRALFEIAAESPDAMRLATIEIAAVGEPGIERRERAVLELGELVEDCLRSGEDSAALPPTVLRAMTGGLTRVIATYLRRGRRARPAVIVPELVRWVSSYHPAPSALDVALAGKRNGQNGAGAIGVGMGIGQSGGRAPGTLSPKPPLNGRRRASRRSFAVSRSYVVHNQRARVLDAVTNLTASNGYLGLTIEDIAAEASVSLQAFYEHFESKEDAFIVAYELGHARGLSLVERAFAAASPDWRRGVRDGLGALMDYLASEPSFAHLSLLATLVATPRTAELSTRGLATYAQLLTPGFEEAPRGNRPRPVIVDATAGALHELFQHYAAQGRTCDLPDLRIDATYIALAPFVGAKEAAQIALG